MGDARIYVNFIFDSREVPFEDSISFFESEEGLNYFQETDSSYQLSGNLYGTFSHQEEPLSAPLDNYENIIFRTPCYNYIPPEEGPDRLRNLRQFISCLYQEFKPVYVYGINNWRIDAWQEGRPKYKISPPINDERLANNRIEHPTWLMLFPPEMVEEYGREWLLDLPVETSTELDDGTILLIATESLPGCETDMEVVELIDDTMTPIEEAFEQREL